jgi:hypothetical protein
MYLIDEDYPKRTQSYSLVALLTSSATILIHTADTIGFVINDPSEAVKLKMAATQQHELDFFSRPLNSRLGTRNRYPELFCHLPLGKSLVFCQNKSLAVIRGKAVNNSLTYGSRSLTTSSNGSSGM